MAYISIGSKFKPFSYLELLQPVLMADLEHKALEELYGQLATLANVWDKLADELNDPYTYNMYKTYSTDLANSAEALATLGLTPGSRKNLLDMKKRYSSDIVPIEQAYKKREELTKELRQAQLRDSSIIFNRDISKAKLSDFIKDPNLSYQGVSGNLLTLLSAQAAQSLAKSMREEPRKWKNILGGQYFETMMRKGYKPEEILAASLDDPNAPQELRNIMSLVYTSSGIDSWNDSEASLRAKQYIGRGLYSAIGETTYLNLSNKAYDEALRRKSTKELKAPKVPLLDFDTYLTSRNIQKMGDLIDPKTGRLTPTAVTRLFLKDDKGLYRPKEQFRFGYEGGTAAIVNPNYSRYKDFMSTLESLGLPKDASISLIEKLTTAIASNNMLGDVNARKRGRVVLDSESSDVLKNRILSANRGQKFLQIEGYNSNGKYKTVKLADSEDVLGEDTKIAQYNYDYVTGEPSFMVVDKDGEVKEFKLPKGTFDSNVYKDLVDKTKLIQEIKDNYNNTPYYNINGLAVPAQMVLDALTNETYELLQMLLNYNGKLNVNK